MYRTVFWDFNGTIVDDVEMVVALNNEVFAKYGVALFRDVDHYRSVFRFPIRAYYKDIGVSDDIFDQVANAWSRGYVERARGCALREGVVEAIASFERAGIRQVVISASKHSHLLEQLGFYPQLNGRFEEILGLDDIYAASKVHLAVDYCARHRMDAREAVFIGDTLHDAQVAREIGCDCVLVEKGHQLRETLLTAGVTVVKSIAAAKDYILEGQAALD